MKLSSVQQEILDSHLPSKKAEAEQSNNQNTSIFGNNNTQPAEPLKVDLQPYQVPTKEYMDNAYSSILQNTINIQQAGLGYF